MTIPFILFINNIIPINWHRWVDTYGGLLLSRIQMLVDS